MTEITGPVVAHQDPVEQLGFTMIPNAVLLNGKLSLPARILYGILKYFAWQGANCYPGQQRLAEILDVTERSVRNYLAELEDAGLLRRERRGPQETNLYTLIAPKLWKPVSVQTGTSVPVSPGNHVPPNKTQKREEYKQGEESNHFPPPLTDEERAEALTKIQQLRNELGLG